MMKKTTVLLLACIPPAARADLPDRVQSFSAVDSGDTAWILISAALVLFMTLPGLALFYAGMVRKKKSWRR